MTTSAMYCEHANECPYSCPCDECCYCKSHSCKQVDENLGKKPMSKITNASELIDRMEYWANKNEEHKYKGQYYFSISDVQKKLLEKHFEQLYKATVTSKVEREAKPGFPKMFFGFEIIVKDWSIDLTGE